MSKSDELELVKRVNDALNTENEHISHQAELDISRARIQAIKNAQLRTHSSFLTRLMTKPSWLVAGPLALSAMLLVIVNFNTNDTIPVLPTNIYTQDIPMEDFAMLEELEFASWLAEQQEGLY